MSASVVDLAGVLRGQLTALGSDARSVTVQRIEAWTFVRITVATVDALRALAADLGLAQARILLRGREQWRRVLPDPDGLVVVTAGLHHGAAVTCTSATPTMSEGR